MLGRGNKPNEMVRQATIKQNGLQTWVLVKLLSQKNTFNQNAGRWRNFL